MRLRSPAPYSGDVAHQQSARLTCERQRGQHSSLPPFSRGHSSASQSGCFTCIRSKAQILLPSPFLSLWCSPANMPASHAGDHRSEAGQGRQFHRRVVHGEQQTHLTQNQAALDVQVVSRRPFSKPPKHCQRCICSVSRLAWCNSGWGLHFHNPNAVEPALKWVS